MRARIFQLDAFATQRFEGNPAAVMPLPAFPPEATMRAIAATYAYATCLFAAQVLFSRWWLSRHAQGPMEALWRRWTYGRPVNGTAASS
jgi:hypothetical protein